ncbi:large conductance mechanosensitive channel protein MscL [Demequina activiva]|uniref:Large-conductance mechanosensitive channel n=1 Tax=Demequina activiva TaxID=1582364 RepID=A0A919UKG1_9MICO|nr:large conductance mechanosensitive channel protein MscL [Demequina activiva]GIG53668.1 large-conductance mechanosensitive channel [Demequina activiva]
MIQGFKDFITRGNVVDLAVAVVIGGAFAAVIAAIVEGFINPLIALIFGQPSLIELGNFTINETLFPMGLILDALFKFITVALAIYFLVVVPLNKLAERRKKGEPAVDEPASPTEIELLTEIRDALRARDAQ